MANQMGPMEIHCDAPPYSIVRACRKIGMLDPEDVAWYRFRSFLSGQYSGSDPLKSQPWKLLFGVSQSDERKCVCGHRLPLLEEYTFTFLTGREARYRLGQCSRCRTMFWDQV